MNKNLPDSSLVDETLNLLSQMGSSETSGDFDEQMQRRIALEQAYPPHKGMKTWQVAASLLLLAGLNFYMWMEYSPEPDFSDSSVKGALASEFHLSPLGAEVYKF